MTEDYIQNENNWYCNTMLYVIHESFAFQSLINIPRNSNELWQ